MSRIVEKNIDRIYSGIAETMERDSKAKRGSTGCTLSATVYTGDRTAIPKRMQTGSGSPSFCWHCGRQLQRAPGKGLGLFYFNIVRDGGGIEHRVHGDCTKPAIDDGAKVVMPAHQPTENKP